CVYQRLQRSSSAPTVCRRGAATARANCAEAESRSSTTAWAMTWRAFRNPGSADMPAIAAAPVSTPRRVTDPLMIGHALEWNSCDNLPEHRKRLNEPDNKEEGA